MFGFLNTIPEYISDAIIDSTKLVPFLFIIFVFIEIFEYYFSHKINDFVKFSKGIGPVIGTFAAIVPQCGFSVIASTLFIRKFISAGTLLAVYIATSDEAVPILIATPDQIAPMLKIILIKCVIAVVVGYSADLILEKVFHYKQESVGTELNISEDEKGCCGHNIKEENKANIILHPIKHTLTIFIFILIISFVLNFMFEKFGLENIQNYMLQDSILQPVITGIIGLIPNCAVSVVITQMFIKNVISFGSTISGLSSAAGLGLLVLITKNENVKSTALIILTLLFVSIIAGILLQIFL